MYAGLYESVSLERSNMEMEDPPHSQITCTLFNLIAQRNICDVKQI